MRTLVFADESGTGAGSICFAIGALVVPQQEFDRFNYEFWSLKEQHGVANELKWSKISNGHGQINFAIDLLGYVLNSSLSFSSIVVRKDTFQKWRKDKEEAFYTVYTQLFTHQVQLGGEYEVVLDFRQDSYDKHTEVVQTITNRAAERTEAEGRLRRVDMADSRYFPGIQVADILTGAICASSQQYLKKGWKPNRGKRLLIEKFAAMLGWDALWYDTYPNHSFNIWHFPPENWRGKPKTLRPAYHQVGYITPDELKSYN